MKKILKIIIGVILILGGVGLIFLWWPHLLDVIKGTIGLFLILAGIICFLI